MSQRTVVVRCTISGWPRTVCTNRRRLKAAARQAGSLGLQNIDQAGCRGYELAGCLPSQSMRARRQTGLRCPMDELKKSRLPRSGLGQSCIPCMSLFVACKRLFMSVVMTLSLVLAGCSTVPSVHRGAASIASPVLPSRLSQAQADDITIYAVGLVGTPYRYGGNTPDSGFDCSGLIGHVYQSGAGVVPPRTVSRLQNWGQPISGDDIRSGDLVLFAPGDVATHAGIYVGDGRFVHAPSTGGEVRLDRLSSKYWSSQLLAFRRP